MFGLWPTTQAVHPTAQISKVKDLSLILFISFFSLASLHLLSKNILILSSQFATLLHTHNLKSGLGVIQGH